jgi:rhamnose transport system permease protein
MKWRTNLGDLVGAREGVTFAFLVIVFTVFTVLSPYFYGVLNFSFIFTDSIEIGLIALTMTMVMVMGEIDLSVGSIVGLSGAMLGDLSSHGVPFVAAIFLALLTGLVAGLINGMLCIKFQLPSLVVTLGTFALYRGVAELLIGANTIVNFPSWFLGWDTHYVIGYVTYPQLFWLGCTLVAIVVLHRLRFGRQVTFIGANARAALFAGIRVNRYKLVMFGASGLMSAMASLILVSRLQSLDNTAGIGFELVVITAVLLGGTDYRGGHGTVIGTFLAVLLVGAVENGLGLLNVSSQVTTATVGILLIVSILVDLATKKAQIKLLRSRRDRSTASPLAPPSRGTDLSTRDVSQNIKGEHTKSNNSV